VEEKESRSPVPAHLLPPSLIEEPESAAAMYAPYELADLTIPSYVGLARRLVDDKKLWKRFLAAIYVGSGAELEE
jgi:endopolyphosphatase